MGHQTAPRAWPRPERRVRARGEASAWRGGRGMVAGAGGMGRAYVRARAAAASALSRCVALDSVSYGGLPCPFKHFCYFVNCLSLCNKFVVGIEPRHQTTAILLPSFRAGSLPDWHFVGFPLWSSHGLSQVSL